MAMTFGGYPPPPLHKSTHTTGGIDALSASDIGAQPSAYTIVSISSNLLNGDKVALDTTSAALTSTLPSAPVNGDTIYILDYAGTFDSNNLTIARNGNNIESLAEDLVCNVQKAAFSLVYAGSTVGWKVVPQTSQMPSTQLANTWQVNQTFNGTNNVAPNQTAASGSSLMTRELADVRYSRWDNSHEITNFTGSFDGVVSGGSTSHRGGYTQLRAAQGGSYRSINTYYRGSFTNAFGVRESGAYLSRTVFALIGDIRCYAAWFPVLGAPSPQWSGKGMGTVVSDAVMPYFLYRDEAWYAMKHTFVRGSASVYPVRASNIVTIETNGAHNLNPGDYVVVAGVAPQSMQTWRSEVLSTPTSTSFTYANTGADETGTTILGDNMNMGKIEELGSVATTSSSNQFTGVRMWDLRVAMSDTGTATFYANGTVVGTGTGFDVATRTNIARVGYGIETLSTATVISDMYIHKFEHIINP